MRAVVVNSPTADLHLTVFTKDFLLGRDDAIFQRDRAENRLERRAWLEGVLESGIVKAVVGVCEIGVQIGKGQYFTGKRIQDYRAATARARSFDLVAQAIFGKRLQI